MLAARGQRMRKKACLLANAPISIVRIKIAVLGRGLVLSCIISNPGSQADLLLGFHLNKWANSRPPIITQNRFFSVVVQARLRFHARFRFISYKKSAAGREPF